MSETSSLPPSSTVGDKSAFRELVTLAAPTVATMTSYTALQFTDKLIVSGIGPDPIYVGAQGNGGLAAFVPISIAMGFITVVNTYVSQNSGAGKPERAPAFAWNGIWLACAWAIVLIPYGLFMPTMFSLMGHDDRLVQLESSYGQILVFGAVLTMCTRAVAQFFYGMHTPSIVLVAGVVANVVNVVLTYGMVHGVFGMPKLGIAGSAIGTVISTGVELSIPLAIFLGPKLNRLYGTRRAWRPSMAHIRDIARIGWASGLMFGNEMICWAIFMVYFVGTFGPIHSNAGWIAHQYMSLSFMPTVGISVAITAMVGKCLGAGRPDLALRRAWVGIGVATCYMMLCGVCFVVFREPMIRLFMHEDATEAELAQTIALGSWMLILTAGFQFFDAIAMTTSAALRGAGDTVVPGLVTVIVSWVTIVLGGWAAVEYLPHWESLGPWTAASLYIVILCVFLFARFLQGRWLRMKLLERSASVEAEAGIDAPTVEHGELRL